MYIAKLKAEGMKRVLNSDVGMTFIVDSFTDTVDNRGLVAHVRDYRYEQNSHNGFQIWSIGPDGYELVEG